MSKMNFQRANLSLKLKYHGFEYEYITRDDPDIKVDPIKWMNEIDRLLTTIPKSQRSPKVKKKIKFKPILSEKESELKKKKRTYKKYKHICNCCILLKNSEYFDLNEEDQEILRAEIARDYFELNKDESLFEEEYLSIIQTLTATDYINGANIKYNPTKK